MVQHIRTVRTASGARAVQIVYSSRKGSRDIDHVGSVHTDADLELLIAVARQKLAAGQDELDLGLQRAPEAGGPLPIQSSRMAHLWDALSVARWIKDTAGWLIRKFVKTTRRCPTNEIQTGEHTGGVKACQTAP